MKEAINLSFKVVNDTNNATYSNGCSGSRSDCCTRVCTRGNGSEATQSSLDAWEQYLDVNAGVLQY